MAQTWRFSRKRHALLRIADLIGRAATAPFRRARTPLPAPQSPRRILVIELFNVGDVVLATPILSELRRRYPEARISILAKPYARELLQGSGLVDDVIALDLPWTSPRNKYRFTVSLMREMRALVHTLRARRFDVTLDSRMDIRSNLLAAMSGTPHRLGYDIGGGGWLLTQALPSNRDNFHKIDDWIALLDLLTDKPSLIPSERPRPTLVVTEGERARARQKLTEAGATLRPLIAYHPGASSAGKRWPREHFEELIRDLSTSPGGTQIVFLGPQEQATSGWPPNAIVFRERMRELMALMSYCDVLVCNDSGPMHIADALGVPVVTIFEVGNPQWFGPSGAHATVIPGELAGQRNSAAALYRPPPHPVPVSRVAEAVRETLRAGH